MKTMAKPRVELNGPWMSGFLHPAAAEACRPPDRPLVSSDWRAVGLDRRDQPNRSAMLRRLRPAVLQNSGSLRVGGRLASADAGYGTHLLSASLTSGFTLVEVVVASAVLFIAFFAMYGAVAMGYSMICDAQQRLDAEALAFDKAVEVLNTTDFAGIRIATNLPAQPVPPCSVLPTNSTIRVGIFPNVDTPTPFKWDIEVRVKRGRVWGGTPADSNNDVCASVTRYAVERN